jgi:UPF0755 protein
MPKTLLITIITILSGILITSVLVAYIYLNKPLNVSQSIIIEIEVGDNIYSIADELIENEIVRYKLPFILTARFLNIAQYIKAGSYSVETTSSIITILNDFVSSNQHLYRFRIQEGSTFNELLTSINENDLLNKENLSLEAIKNEINQDLEAESLEGVFFPETFFYAKNTPALEILLQSNEIMANKLSLQWENRAHNLSIETPYEALIIASIIEKEAGVEDEKRIISGVIHRRLNLGMKLQMDPTVYYGINKSFTEQLTYDDLINNNEFNTYVINGLPPTPICLPSETSIHAALNPDESDYLYFVATGLNDGRHIFTSNNDDHNRAVEIYRNRIAND